MRLSRKLGLFGSQYTGTPTFAKLFGTLRSINSAGAAYASSGTPSIANIDDMVGNSVWFSFYCVGASMEISRLQKVNGTLTKTRIGTYRPSGSTAYTTSLNGTGISGDQSVYGFHMSFIKPAYDPDIVEQMFRSANIGTIHYYYSDSYTNAGGSLRVEKASVLSHAGVYYTAFVDVRSSSGPTNNAWGVGDTQTPSVAPIVGQIGSDPAPSLLREFTSNNVAYIAPAATVSDGSANARVKSYTLKYFTETW